MAFIQCPPLPADTARAAESAFGSGHPYLRIGKRLESLLADLDLSAIATSDKSLADTFLLYSMATILQYREKLTDRQTFDATRSRADLKYALHLPLNFPGLPPIALCQFRLRLRKNQAGRDLFMEMAERLGSFNGGRENTSAGVDHILDDICTRSRTEEIVNCMNNAIEATAASQPEWLRSIALPHWYERYYRKPGSMRIPNMSQQIESLLQVIGEDGAHLLNVIDNSGSLVLAGLPEIRELRQEWQWQFESDESGRVKFRATSCEHCLANRARN